ncbi:MAG: hypothetical protein V3V67_00780 [Myxococcota bacterium]
MDLVERSRELFRGLERDVFGGALHSASSEVGDLVSALSCAHHALALRHIDPALALSELRTLYAACQLESGLLAEERPLTAEGQAERAAEFGPLYREDGPSWLIGPPVAAYAAAKLAQQLGDPARGILERATRQLDAIWAERLPPDTPLPVILHPLEAVAYGSALFDGVIESTDMDEWRDEAANITRSAVACRLDPERALRAGHPFVVEDPIFCGWLLLGLEEAARAWELLGEGDVVRKLRIRADMIAEGVAERLWWDEEELFAGVDRRREAPLRAVTAGGLVPAAAHTLLAGGNARRALDRHLRPSSTPLWSSRGIAVAPVERDEALDPDAVPWRGGGISAATCYWGHLALVHGQRTADARVAREQLERLTADAGFREFYDVRSGEGSGGGANGGFTWPTLALEMRAQES